MANVIKITKDMKTYAKIKCRMLFAQLDCYKVGEHSYPNNICFTKRRYNMIKRKYTEDE